MLFGFEDTYHFKVHDFFYFAGYAIFIKQVKTF